jgi:hypothetical protein
LFQQTTMLILNPLELLLLMCRVAFLVSVSLILAYFITALIYSVWLEWIDLKKNWFDLRRKQQIPCYLCIFCTGEESLKCTVHPDTAFSKKAINCPDYQPIHRYVKSQS